MGVPHKRQRRRRTVVRRAGAPVVGIRDQLDVGERGDPFARGGPSAGACRSRRNEGAYANSRRSPPPRRTAGRLGRSSNRRTVSSLRHQHGAGTCGRRGPSALRRARRGRGLPTSDEESEPSRRGRQGQARFRLGRECTQLSNDESGRNKNDGRAPREATEERFPREPAPRPRQGPAIAKTWRRRELGAGGFGAGRDGVRARARPKGRACYRRTGVAMPPRPWGARRCREGTTVSPQLTGANAGEGC